MADVFHRQRRLWVRLNEKGGKFHEMPWHHTLEGYLTEYIEHARLAEAGRVPLFQAIKCRPYGRREAQLNGERLHQTMLGLWCAVAPRRPTSPPKSAPTSSAALVTAYLENGGTLEKARQMAPHASPA